MLFEFKRTILRPFQVVIILLFLLTLVSCNLSEKKRNKFHVRANEFLDKRDFNNAIKNYDEAVQIDPQFASGWNNKGIAHFELGQYSEAIAAYNNAILAKPEMNEAYFNRAKAFMHSTEYKMALNDLNVVAEVFPDTSEVYFRKVN